MQPIFLDIIDEMKGKIRFIDPMFKYWLTTRYFGSLNTLVDIAAPAPLWPPK